MYPDFSYLLHHWFGTEPDNWASIIKTFGLLLAIAILSAAFLLERELRRKANEGVFKPIVSKEVVGDSATVMEILGGALFGFLLGFKILYIVQNFPTFQEDAAAVILSPLGSWTGGLIGALILGGIRYYDKHRLKRDKPEIIETKVYPHERIGDITIVAAITGIIGAKLFAVVEDLPSFFQDPLGQFFSASGMAVYGGLIGGFIGCSIYLKLKKIPVLPALDAVAPALMIAYGIGRMGCQLSGDGDWGIINELAKPGWMSFLPDWMWSYDYPNNVIDSRMTDPVTGVLLTEEIAQIPNCTWNYCTKLAHGVFPTPFYETIMAFIIGGFLWAIRKKVQIAGLLFFIYMIFNGAERFLIEKIRVNPVYEKFGFQTTQAEFIAVCLMLIGLAGCLWVWFRSRNKEAMRTQ